MSKIDFYDNTSCLRNDHRFAPPTPKFLQEFRLKRSTLEGSRMFFWQEASFKRHFRPESALFTSPVEWRAIISQASVLKAIKNASFLCVWCLGRKLCIKINKYVLHISQRFSTPNIASYTHPFMSHHTYTHDIFEKIMWVCPRVLGIGMHVLYVSISLLLQQDNARPHLARATTQYLSQANVNIMDDWPALSIDLNPVEHCSDYLKKRIRKLQLEMSGTSMYAIRREWQTLPQGFIRHLVRSMRRRCDAVFKANGGHTRYWTSKSVTVNDEFDSVKILRICLSHWMVFNNEMEFLCLYTINLLEYDCFQRWIVNFSPKIKKTYRKWHQSQTCIFKGLKYIIVKISFAYKN